MRKFKVISEYPSSPCIDDILTYQTNDKEEFDDEGNGISLGNAETYSECFEEILVDVDLDKLEKAYERQVELQDLMQANGLNLINCNGKDCSNMLIHPTVSIASNEDEEIIVCPCCGEENFPNDCSDVYYQTH